MWHVLLLGYLLLLLDINRGKEGIKYKKYNHDLGKNTSCKNMKTQEKIGRVRGTTKVLPIITLFLVSPKRSVKASNEIVSDFIYLVKNNTNGFCK